VRSINQNLVFKPHAHGKVQFLRPTLRLRKEAEEEKKTRSTPLSHYYFNRSPFRFLLVVTCSPPSGGGHFRRDSVQGCQPSSFFVLGFILTLLIFASSILHCQVVATLEETQLPCTISPSSLWLCLYLLYTHCIERLFGAHEVNLASISM
jgi:hypothetical protein